MCMVPPGLGPAAGPGWAIPRARDVKCLSNELIYQGPGSCTSHQALHAHAGTGVLTVSLSQCDAPPVCTQRLYCVQCQV